MLKWTSEVVRGNRESVHVRRASGRTRDVIIVGDRDASEGSRRCRKMYRAQAKRNSRSIL